MGDTATLRCPYKFDDVAGTGLDCETTNCAAWNATAGECILLQAAFRTLKYSHSVDQVDRTDYGL